MNTVLIPDESSSPTTKVQDQIHTSDPHSYLRPQLTVKGRQSRRLGKIDTVEHDADGILTGIVVRHGLFGRKYTRIPVERIKQVNSNAVVIEYSASLLNKLPRIDQP